MMADLKPCPFCGGKADIKHGTIFMDETYMVRCETCFCMTNRFFVNNASLLPDGKPNPKTKYTALQAINKAVESWNRRADDGN